MNDEVMHAVGDDPAWSESYYFNFVDPNTRLGMFTRMGFRPGNGWADALHVVYLEGKRVAFTYGRREIGNDLSAYDGDLSAGDLTLICEEAHRRWRITYSGPAQDIADAQILLQRRKSRPQGWYEPATLNMDLTFDCLTQPHYSGQGARGHFEQSGHVAGTITLNDNCWEVSGYGVRDKSWGPRDWGAGTRSSEPTMSGSSGPSPFVNWFSMNFGDYAAMGGACGRGENAEMVGSGWMQRDGENLELENVRITSSYQPDSIVHTGVRLAAITSQGEELQIEGRVLNVCPTKIAMPGGATFVNEGLAEFRWGERTGFGIAEHWHAVSVE